MRMVSPLLAREYQVGLAIQGVIFIEDSSPDFESSTEIRRGPVPTWVHMLACIINLNELLVQQIRSSHALRLLITKIMPVLLLMLLAPHGIWHLRYGLVLLFHYA
ncbi:hypothetical protein V6N13_144097 [Hibiscus sabdariffa]